MVEQRKEFTVSYADFISEKTGKIRDTYKIGHKVGDGAFGSVRKITHRKTGEIRAVKTISKNSLSAEEKASFFNEVNVLKAVDHPNILKLYEFYQDSKNYYLVTEFCTGGELFDRIIEKGHFTEAMAAQYMEQILSAVLYCHSRGIVHRDLKPENFVLDSPAEDAVLKVIDFGTSQFFQTGETLKKKYGTPYYIAPEVLKKNYNEKCDIWSAGVNLYILLCGFPPFHGSTDEEIMKRVEKGIFTFPSPEWDTVSAEAKDLIQKMLTYDYTQRSGAEQALQHPWFIKYKTQQQDTGAALNSLSKLKTFKAEQRLSKAILTFIASQLSTKQEKDQLQEAFKALDVNHDGKLSREELINGYEKYFGTAEDIEVEVDKIMNQVDTDRSGFIDYTEFVIATMEKNKLLSNNKLQAAFNSFDVDGSGTISVDEIAQMLGKSGKYDRTYWEEVVREVDGNGDGEIDFNEFCKMMNSIFQA